ncbi:MAG: carboxymuconolactone decarboxylase family protein [Acidobacteria bacterium]|nr:carboxymuconolactone decarboxylase family protein [Acidobacteriota bacterium]
MSLEALLESLPAHAKDLKLNLGAVLRQTELTPTQLWGTAVACAYASRNAQLRDVIVEEAGKVLEPVAMEAAKSASAIMGMNNIYYRFLHLVEHPKYAEIPARLRMNVIRMHGIAPVDFELFCVAVSAINGCGACMASHDRVVREKGLAEESVLASVRIASVIHAVAVVLDGATPAANA